MLPRPESEYTVLVVDDDLDLLPFLVDTLSLKSAFQVVTAADGVQALERFEEHHPDCVLIDVRMPHLNGVQVVRALRGDPATADVPVVILTALVMDRDRFAGLAAGADQYLVKPVEPDEIVAALRQAIALSAQERAERYHTYAQQIEQYPPKK
jgi:OmpR family response regulator RpaB